MRDFDWTPAIPITFVLIVLMMIAMMGCGSSMPLRSEMAKHRVNETSGWVALGVYQYADGQWLIHRYENEFRYHSFELWEPGRVSSHFTKFAENFCMEARSVNRNAAGALTNQTLTPDVDCHNFNIFWSVRQ
jgi:hypothetical protein